MNQAITVELQFFLISILWGVILLLVYDALRIIRRLIKHDSFFVAVEDLIFWVAASLFIFAMMYKENNGIIRGFSVMGMAIGMVLYHYIFSELLVNAITKLIRTLFRPFGIVFGWVKHFFCYLLSIGKNIVKFLVRRLKKWRKSVKISMNIKKQEADIKRKKLMEKKSLEKIEAAKKASEKKAQKEKALKEKAAKEKVQKEKVQKEIAVNKVINTKGNKNKLTEKKALTNMVDEKKIIQKKKVKKS